MRLNTEATAELVRSLHPDDVIVATGAVRELPPIPGCELDHVFSGEDMRKMMLGESSDALKRKMGLATRLATKIGCRHGHDCQSRFRPQSDPSVDAARRAHRDHRRRTRRPRAGRVSVERGRTVAVIEEGPKFGRGPHPAAPHAPAFPSYEIMVLALHAEARDIQIGKEAVRFTAADGAIRTIPADHVIIAKGAQGDSTVAHAVRAAGLTVTEIGDGTGVGYIEGAIRGAARAVLGSAAIPPV